MWPQRKKSKPSPLPRSPGGTDGTILGSLPEGGPGGLGWDRPTLAALPEGLGAPGLEGERRSCWRLGRDQRNK